MKQVISVSLGASSRNHEAMVHVDGEDYRIVREGWDGDLSAMRQRLLDLDGTVDAIGLGGCSCYLYGKNGKKYPLRAICKLAKTVKKTPLVDGSALKDTLERDIVPYIADHGFELKEKKLLMVCALERLGMAEAFEEAGADIRYGDMMFSLGLPGYFRKLATLHRIMSVVAPIISILPFSILYPSGSSHPEKVEPKWGKHFAWADIIAGDYLYIRNNLPDDLTGKIIITNTVTPEDTAALRQRGVYALITATPLIDGRSFGTNVIEALLTAMEGRGTHLQPDDYRRLFAKTGLSPRVEYLTNQKNSA